MIKLHKSTSQSSPPDVLPFGLSLHVQVSDPPQRGRTVVESVADREHPHHRPSDVNYGKSTFLLILFYNLTTLRFIVISEPLPGPVVVVDVSGALASPSAALGDPPYHLEEPSVDSLVTGEPIRGVPPSGSTSLTCKESLQSQSSQVPSQSTSTSPSCR